MTVLRRGGGGMWTQRGEPVMISTKESCTTFTVKALCDIDQSQPFSGFFELATRLRKTVSYDIHFY